MPHSSRGLLLLGDYDHLCECGAFRFGPLPLKGNTSLFQSTLDRHSDKGTKRGPHCGYATNTVVQTITLRRRKRVPGGSNLILDHAAWRFARIPPLFLSLQPANFNGALPLPANAAKKVNERKMSRGDGG